MDQTKIEDYVNQFWDDHITPTLVDYIRIPNKSPGFDPDWIESGHMATALDLAKEWD
uniref:Uncharacterized protein n=1 Tax=uncultured bacterium 1250012-L08 TaxID=1343838 RepID=S4W3Z4_9BACT|nr:hypothetical protein [uncultured bacterium 1250012-L08]